MIRFAVFQEGQSLEEMGIHLNPISYFPPCQHSGNMANQGIIDSVAIPRTESKNCREAAPVEWHHFATDQCEALDERSLDRSVKLDDATPATNDWGKRADKRSGTDRGRID